MSIYYFSLYFNPNDEMIKSTFINQDLGLPSIDSLEWYIFVKIRFTGFEWKGVFFRVQTYNESRCLFREIKGLEYIFLEYIQMIDTYKINKETNLLSNDIIFPIISYVQHSSLVMMATVCINKIFYENPLFDIGTINNSYRGKSNTINYNYLIDYNFIDLVQVKSNKNCLKSFKTIKSLNKNSNRSIPNINRVHDKDENPFIQIKRNSINNNLSQIQKDISIHSYVSSINLNEDIILDDYCRDDINHSPILKRILKRNLIKIVDELGEKTTYKFKFLIASVDNLIPDIIPNENLNNFIHLPENGSNTTTLFFNQNKVQELYSTFQLRKEDILDDSKITYEDINIVLNKKADKLDNSLGIYEDILQGLRFKIFYNNKEKEHGNNSNCDSFIKIYSDFISLSTAQLKEIKRINEGHFVKLKKFFDDNMNLNIRTAGILMYSLEYSVKLQYSLIKSYDFKCNNKSKLIITIITNLAKVLNSNYNVDNILSLKKQFRRYGLNSSFDLFVLRKVKSPQITNVIKLWILCKIMKRIVYFHEGLSLELNQCLFSSGTTQKIGYDQGNLKYFKDKKITNFHLFHIYNVILTILDLQHSSIEYSSFFYKNLNFFIYLRIMKYHLINEHFNILDGFSEKISVSGLIRDLFESANKHTFLFLSFMEETFSILIDPYTKFQASISRENFLSKFKLEHLQEEQFIPKSYTDITNIAYYLLAKCISNSHRIDSYRDNIVTPKIANLVDPQYRKETANILLRQSKETKPLSTLETSNNDLNMARLKNEDITLNEVKGMKVKKESNIQTKYTVSGGLNNESCKKKMNHLNFPVNSNNIMKINYINHKYVEEKKFDIKELKNNNFKNKKKLGMINTADTIKLDALLNKSFYLENIEFPFPPLLYKMKFLEEDKIKPKLNINKYLCNKYFINRIEILNDWRTQLEILFAEYYSLSSSESIILDIYILQFINAYFIDSDNCKSKEFIIRMKEILRLVYSYSPERLAIISLLEGLTVESRNYVESEEFYSKSIVILLLLYGDPRGRGCSGKVFMLYPLWKLCRQTCILENSMIHENFKEFFYAQDYILKCYIDQITVNNNHSEDETIDKNIKGSIKINSQNLIDISQRENEVYQGQNTSENNVILDENDQILDMIDIECDKLSQDNYENIKHKYFPFPSISDIKTSYSKYFKSINFVNFLVKNLPILTLSDRKWNEDTLLSLNIFNINNSSDMMSQSVMSFQSHYSQKSFNTSRKVKERIFSIYICDNFIERLNFRMSPPNGVMMTWGHNVKNETTHDNYENIYLPRMCFKLKEEEIVSTSCGWDFNIALTNNNTLFSWGNNESGQCALNSKFKVANHPMKIDNLYDVKMVSCGNEHALALLYNGDLYSWGKGNGGVLGFEHENSMYSPHKLEGFNFVSICSGSLHNLALGKDGALYSWGCGEGGQLGHSEETLIKYSKFGCLNKPTKINALNQVKIKKFSCGEAHCIVLTEDNRLFGWGFTSNGQLGLGFCADSFEIGQGIVNSRILQPRLINDINFNIIDINCGKTFSTFLSDQNELLVCGVNDMNQLGIEQPSSIDHIYYKEDLINNKCMDVVTPTFVECFLKMKVIKVACGESHCLAIIEDVNTKLKGVWSWGSNKFGQLGLGSQVKKSLARPNNFFFGLKISDIACGAYHSVCIVSKDINKWDHSKNTKIFKEINEDNYKLWSFR